MLAAAPAGSTRVSLGAGCRRLLEKGLGGNLVLVVSGIGVPRKAIGSDKGYVDGVFRAGHSAKVVYLVPCVGTHFLRDAVLFNPLNRYFATRLSGIRNLYLLNLVE